MKLVPFLAVALLPLFAQAASPANPEKSNPRLDPEALASLQRMSNSLAGAKAFTVRTKTILELPAITGQFITLFSTGRIALERPNKLRASLTGDAPHFDFYYDGSTVSAYAPQTNVYSTKPAPPTIDAMLDGLRAETGIRFATGPLLTSDPAALLTRGLLSAVDVGPSLVDGHLCEHLAFRAPGVNWEIWLEPDSRALPRRLAVTFTDKPGFPRTIVEFSDWNLRPWSLGSFAFTPPAGVKEIPFTSVLKTTAR
jgi:hypothetical protein